METLEEMLRRHEGYKDRVYNDSLGFLTVGYGHHLYPGSRINKLIADELLKIDIADAVNDFMKLDLIRIQKLNVARRRVIINMIFNIGFQKVLQFKKMWKYIECEDYELASREMLNSKWAKQVKTRAIELAEIMKKGE